jgi:flagellar hook-associated protein 1 FlgK
MMVQLENQRESVSGVSLDEEMINLIKFQNAYTAAAKMITTADEMMQTVLQMV